MRLYTIDSADRTRVWEVCGEERNGLYGISQRSGLENGKLTEWVFKESKPKNIGKANSTTSYTQAAIDLENLKGVKLRSNYFETVELARSNKLFLPMLAEKFEKRSAKLVYPVACQPKYDGSRCNIYYSELLSRVVTMSRTGKEIVSVPHLIAATEDFLTKNKHIILDGEIYNHDLKDDFEQLMSLTRQSKPTAADLEKSRVMLKYYLYDIYSKTNQGLSFDGRNEIIDFNFQMTSTTPIVLVPTVLINSQEELLNYEDLCLQQGYEGIMVRIKSSVYKVDGRSADLLKKKIFTDEEFPIVDILEGDGAWKGCAKKIVIILPDGRTQGAGIDGNFEVNKERLQNKNNYIGSLATVKYFGKTQEGILRFPVVKDIARPDL